MTVSDLSVGVFGDVADAFCISHFEGDVNGQSQPCIADGRNVVNLRRKKRIILVTPEYHGGYSGVLKNALDLMGFDEFEGKMLGLVGVSGGRMGAFGARNSLREVGRALHA
jgi:FMN reductase